MLLGICQAHGNLLEKKPSLIDARRLLAIYKQTSRREVTMGLTYAEQHIYVFPPSGTWSYGGGSSGFLD